MSKIFNYHTRQKSNQSLIFLRSICTQLTFKIIFSVWYVAPTLSGIEKLSTVLQQVMKQPIVVLNTC